MTLSFETLLQAALDTLRNPRAGARDILALGLTTGQAMLALILMAVLSTLLTALSFILSPLPPDVVVPRLFGNPLELALLQAAALTLGAWLVHVIGGRFDGRGSLAGALALIAWTEFILSLMQVAQIIALLLLPPLVDVIGIAGLVVFLWLLSQFVTELHGFANVWKVLAVILATGFMLSFAVAILLVSLFGTGV